MADSDAGEREQPSLSSLSIGPDDWPAVAADKIVAVVGTIRSHTVDNLTLAVRAVVYGLAAVAFSSASTVLAVVIAVRMADAYLPIGSGVGSATWAAYAFTGTLVSVLGIGAWRARSSTARPVRIAVLIDAVLVSAVLAYGAIIHEPTPRDDEPAADPAHDEAARSESAHPTFA